MPPPRENSIDYLEVPSRDLAQTRAFFRALFGWEFTDYGENYTSFSDGRLSGGFFTAPTVARLSAGTALVVFYVADLEGVLERCRALGATITAEIFSFPGGRRFHFTEPGGSEFAIWSDR